MKNVLEGICGLIGATLCFMFGKIDTSVVVLLLFVGCDYFTGIAKAIVSKKLSSKIGIKGFIKKIVLLVIVAMGVQLDRVMGTNGILRNFVIYYYIATEGLSILENAISLGIPIPSAVVKVLEQMESENK